MRLIFVLAAVALVAGCSRVSPVEPTGLTSARTPSGLYVCSTQPRGYCNADGTACWWEADVYTQSTPCPLIPIK